MKKKRKPRKLTYFYVHGFEAETLHKHTVWKKAHRTVAEPGAAAGLEAGRKGHEKHGAGGA